MGLQDTLINTGMGLLLEGHNDRRQLRQQGKLNEQQYDIDNRMAEANYERQMRMWQATNYGAQMEQLSSAGLNPALMYKQGGSGGITGNPQGSVSGAAKAPAGGMEIMNMMATRAQIDLIKAQTEKTKAETGNVPLTGQNIQAQTNALNAGIKNTEAQTKLTDIQREIQEINWDMLSKNENFLIGKVRYETEQAHQEVQNLMYRNKISEAEANTITQRIKLSMANTAMDTWLKSQQGQAASAEAKYKVNEIQMRIQENMRNWDRLGLDTEMEHSYNTMALSEQSDFPKELTEILKAIGFGAILKGGGAPATPIRGFHKRD